MDPPFAPTTNAQGIADERSAAQHARGKLMARERIDLLLDAGSFEEIDPFIPCEAADVAIVDGAITDGVVETRTVETRTNDGVVTGWGTVTGRPVFIVAKDMTVFGGSLSKAHARKIIKLQEMALSRRAPILTFFDSVGVRLQDGLAAVAGYGEIFQHSVRASGVVLQIAVIMGPCVGADAIAAALNDFVFMVRDAGTVFVTGPDIVKALANETVSGEELGGAGVHTTTSALADGAYDNDVEALLQLRRFLDFLSLSNGDDVPAWPSFDDAARTEMSLDSLAPDDPSQPYDIKELLLKIVDEGDFFEIGEAFAQNIVTGFGRIGGRTVGFLANQPLVLGGVLDIDAVRKAARFVRFCDRFNIAIVSFVDVPGFLPGLGQEHGGLPRESAKLVFAFAEATVAKITIITRKAFGAAYLMMGSKPLLADVSYAWPSAHIGLMGAEAAVELLFSAEIDESEKVAQRVRDYEARILSPAAAAEPGLIDAVIMPHETRPRIARALALLARKAMDRPRKTYGNIEL